MPTAASTPASAFSPADVSLDTLATLVDPHDQDALFARLRATGELLRARYRTAVAGAGAERMARVPTNGGWSALQVLEHLVVAHDDYARVVAPVVAQPVPMTAAAQGATRRWKPSLIGRIIARSLVSTRALPAPKSWRVAAMTPRADVAAAFDGRLADLGDWMEASRVRDWRRTRTHSPISPLLRMNLGDVFVLLTVHAGRHLGQLERAIAQGVA